MRIEGALIEYWRSNSLGQPGDTVIVACSGGPDSLALLDLLWRLRDRLSIKVAAAHYEHGIRGQASREDEAFVAQYCHKRKIPFYSESGNILQLSRERGESIETCARRKRYEFLNRLSVNLAGALIATAHHCDDQAETLLMHFLRGTGLKGLTGILPKRENIIRPLLIFTKQELVEYCHEQGLSPRHDATNDLADCTRNKLRLRLLPLLKEDYNPNIIQSLCNLANTAAAEEALLQQLSREAEKRLELHYDKEKQAVSCKSSLLLGEPLAIRRRLVKQLLSLVNPGCDLDFPHVEAILAMAEKNITGSSLDLPDKCQLRISYGHIELSKKTDKFLTSHGTIEDTPNKKILSLDSKIELPGGGFISARLTDSLEGEGSFSSHKIYCDAAKCGPEFVVRYRRKGDRIRLRVGSKKLKDFFVDAKVDRERRDWVPLVVSPITGEIIWVAGCRQTAVAMTDADTKEYVILSYEKGEE